MNQRAAFEETLVLATKEGMVWAPTNDESLTYGHLLDMWEQIKENDTFSESKLGRWLGWAQAALVAANVGVTLEDVKQINLRHSEDT